MIEKMFSSVEIVPGRELNTLNIYLDIGFLLLLGFLLIKHKKYTAFLFGIFGGILYFIVDYGIFYKALGARVITSENPFWSNYFVFLLWLSLSYGFTNFVMIWLYFDKDKRLIEWISLIIIGWIATGIMGQALGDSFDKVSIFRTTSGYHGWMALFLFASYSAVIIYNLRVSSEKRINILWSLGIGILVQFGWEFALLISGIRQGGIMTLIVNSLLETNLGIPSMYLIHKFVSSKYNEDLSKVDMVLIEAEVSV